MKAPAEVQDLTLEIYDPVYFVSFELAEKDPVTLVAAPAACKLNIARPDSAGVGKFSESFFSNMDPKNPFGTQFANKISVKCQ